MSNVKEMGDEELAELKKDIGGTNTHWGRLLIRLEAAEAKRDTLQATVDAVERSGMNIYPCRTCSVAIVRFSSEMTLCKDCKIAEVALQQQDTTNA